jgi:hypothetical protein
VSGRRQGAGLLVPASCLLLWGCGAGAGPSGRPVLVEKASYQALYTRDGRLERLAYDANGDRRADVMTFYGPGGRPQRAEVDSDLDGVVDRWEEYGEGGRLRRLGVSLRVRARPDTWTVLDDAGREVRRERDDDGDGRADPAPPAPGAR